MSVHVNVTGGGDQTVSGTAGEVPHALEPVTVTVERDTVLLLIGMIEGLLSMGVGHPVILQQVHASLWKAVGGGDTV